MGNAINSIPFIGDLIDDGARAIAQGQRQGAVVNDALKVMTKGKTATDDEIANLIAEVQRMEELGPSDEYNTFQEIATKEGGVFGFLKGLASAPQAVPEVFLQSMSSMVNEATAGIAGLSPWGVWLLVALQGPWLLCRTLWLRRGRHGDGTHLC